MPNGLRENFELLGEDWEEDEDELKKRYPVLWEKYGCE